MKSDVTIAWSDGGAVVASAKNLILSRWDGAPRAAQLHALADHAEALSAAHPSGVALLNVVASVIPSLDREVREEALRLSRLRPERARAVAHVVAVPGVAGAAIRGVLSTVLSFASPRTPTRLFARSEPAATWIAERLPGGWTSGDVAAVWAAVETRIMQASGGTTTPVLRPSGA